MYIHIKRAQALFSFRRRAKGRRATFYAFFVKLHNFCTKNCLNFVQYFCPKPIDFLPQVWYTISVRGRGAEPTRPMVRTGKANRRTFSTVSSHRGGVQQVGCGSRHSYHRGLWRRGQSLKNPQHQPEPSVWQSRERLVSSV